MNSKTIDIWEGLEYGGEMDDKFRPVMDTYLLKGDKVRGAVLVCPGGAYKHTSPREAEPVAIKFNAAGYHAFVLYYSCAPRIHPQPLKDVSRAMCIIRENAAAWNVDPGKVAVCGFSAGGHLAASLGCLYDEAYLKDVKGLTEGLNKPDAMILSYPVISSGEFAHRGSFENLLGMASTEEEQKKMSLEYAVTDKVPPTFIWHTYADGSVPVENTLYFSAALRKNKIPFEMHIYPEGPHGISLAIEETRGENMKNYPHVSTWMALCTEWLSDIMKF